MADLISHMLQLNPKERLSASEYLTKYKGIVFPEYFYSFLHPYMCVLADSRRLVSSAMKGNILVSLKGTQRKARQFQSTTSFDTITAHSVFDNKIATSSGDMGINESDCKVEKIFQEYEEILEAMELHQDQVSHPRKSRYP